MLKEPFFYQGSKLKKHLMKFMSVYQMLAKSFGVGQYVTKFDGIQ
jgi:hypothetical protein